MKKSIVKISVIFLITLLVLLTFVDLGCYAGTVTSEFTGDTSSVKIEKTLNATRTILGIILNTIRTVGLAIAIIILTVIGIKFMLASPSERANIKQYSINYVIGAAFLIGAVGIITIIQNFAAEIKVE